MMTATLLLRAVAVCVCLISTFGSVAAFAQGVLSPAPMVERPNVQASPPVRGPALNLPPTKKGASPSDAVAGVPVVKADFVDEIGDWQLKCFSKPGRACQFSQRQVEKKNKTLIIWVELTHAVTPKESWQLVVMVPLGFRVAPVLGIRSDSELLINMPIVTCVSAGCAYSTEMPVAGLETLRKAKELWTEIDDLKGKRYALKVSMRGFDQAYLKGAFVLKQK